MKNGGEIVQKILEQKFGIRGAKIITCLILMIFGIKNIEIHEKVGISDRSLRRYRKALQGNKVTSLFVNNGYRGRSELEKYNRKIVEEFNKRPPKTLSEAQERIKTMTGLKRSIQRIGVYLKKKGLEVGL